MQLGEHLIFSRVGDVESKTSRPLGSAVAAVHRITLKLHPRRFVYAFCFVIDISISRQRTAFCDRSPMKEREMLFFLMLSPSFFACVRVTSR
jgi:hypothetical protein